MKPTATVVDREGDVAVVSRDEKGVWVEVSERVGGESISTVSAGPFVEEQVVALREAIGVPSGVKRTADAVVLLAVAAGPLALLCGVGWADAGRVLVVGIVLAAIVSFATSGRVDP